MDRVFLEYCNNLNIDFSIYPLPQVTNAVLKPYNSILYTHTTLHYCNCGFLVDNQAIYNIWCANITQPTYTILSSLPGKD